MTNRNLVKYDRRVKVPAFSLRFAAVLYAAFFSALFLPLAMRGELPGNVDTVLGIALSNLLAEKARLFFTASDTLTVFYPSRWVISYGENCFGLGLLFNFFRLLTSDDVWAHGLLVVTLFTGSATGLYRLSSLFVEDRAARFLAGLVFTTAGFILANLDDVNVAFVMLPALALYDLERGLRERETKRVKRAFALAGLQIWFGFYVFLFLCLAIGIHLVVNAKRWLALVDRRAVFRFFAWFAVPAAPILAIYLHAHFALDPAAPFERYNDDFRRASSLALRHFGNVLPDNALYSAETNAYSSDDSSIPSRLRKSAFPGFSFLVFSAIGLLTLARRAKWLCATAAVFLYFSFGVNAPFFEALASTAVGTYMRSPLRFHVFTLLAGAVFFSAGVAWARGKVRNRVARAVLAAAIGLVFVAENVPFPLKAYEFRSLLTPPSGTYDHLEATAGEKILFDLPSSFTPVNSDGEKLIFYNREALYMNWQTHHRMPILGGVNGYIPRSRIETDRIARELPEPGAIARLAEIGATHIVFHKDLVLGPSEDSLSDLKGSSGLRLTYEDERSAVFEISR